MHCAKPPHTIGHHPVPATMPMGTLEESATRTPMPPKIRATSAQREKLLLWMVKNEIRDIQSVGAVLNEYYLNPERTVSLIDKNSSFEYLVNKRGTK